MIPPLKLCSYQKYFTNFSRWYLVKCSLSILTDHRSSYMVVIYVHIIVSSNAHIRKAAYAPAVCPRDHHVP